MKDSSSELLDQQCQFITEIEATLSLLAKGDLTHAQEEHLGAIWKSLEKLKEATRGLGGLKIEGVARDSDLEEPMVLASRALFILVVDDDPVQQIFVTRVLEKRGHRVMAASDGRKGFELAQNSNFDLILMDCQMPEIDGFQLTKAIRKLESTTGKRVPIVAFTSHAAAGYRQRCISVGMDDYLQKPISGLDLIGRVEEICDAPVMKRARALP